MSDRMHCIPFRALLDWVLGEWEESGSIFGCKKLYRAGGDGKAELTPELCAAPTPSWPRTSWRATSAAAGCSSSRPSR